MADRLIVLPAEFIQKMAEFAKEEKELDESQRKLTEALSKDPTDHLAVSLLSCVKKLKTATGRNVADKMWKMQVMSYMKEKGIKMSYSDMMKVASGKMSSGDAALDGMCSMFDSLKGSKSTEVIADAVELFKDKELMDAYGGKFKSAMKYAGKFKGNEVFNFTDAVGDGVSDIASTAVDAAKTPKDAVAAAGGAEDAAKEMVDDEELKKETAKKTGINAFTALGWARLAAKTAGYVLNHGKDVVDALGAKKIKNQEDKNVIAEIRVQLENVGDDQKYSDSEFSVRFTTDDFKWHATCVDDRKMKFPEDTLVKKVLDTETAKKFKEFCLKKWNGIFRPESGSDYSMLPFMLQNIDKFGLKGADAAFFEKVKTVADNMDKIESAFK